MEIVKWFGFDSQEDLMSEWNAASAVRIFFKDQKGRMRYFYVEEDARGVNITNRNPGEPMEEKTFSDIDDLLDNYYDNGIRLRDAMVGNI